MLNCILILCCVFTLTSLCSSVATPTQTVNTNSGCGDMIANAIWRKLASLLVLAWVTCLPSSLFALPSRGSAGLCRVTSSLESSIQSDNLGFLYPFKDDKEDSNSDINSVWSVEGVPAKWTYFLINMFLFTQTKTKAKPCHDCLCNKKKLVKWC